MVDPGPSTNGEKRGGTEGGRDGRVAALYTRHGESVELTDEEVGALLSVGGKVDVNQVAAVQALVTADVVGFENREREAGKAGDVDVVGRKSCGGVDGVFAGRRCVWQKHVPVGIFFSLPTMERIWASTWLTRMTPPLVQGGRRWC